MPTKKTKTKKTTSPRRTLKARQPAWLCPKSPSGEHRADPRYIYADLLYRASGPAVIAEVCCKYCGLAGQGVVTDIKWANGAGGEVDALTHGWAD